MESSRTDSCFAQTLPSVFKTFLAVVQQYNVSHLQGHTYSSASQCLLLVRKRTKLKK